MNINGTIRNSLVPDRWRNSVKTLYVSDLDKTLMRSDKTLSPYTVSTLNRLIRKGVLFTYATARSIQSAKEITGGLEMTLPAVIRNGTTLADNTTGKLLWKAVFSAEEMEILMTRLPELGPCGFVSTYFGDDMLKLCLEGEHSPGMQAYMEEHRNDPRFAAVGTLQEMFAGSPGYVTLVDRKENLESACARMKEYRGWEVVFQQDAYSPDYWLEICPDNSTKAKALLRLKAEIGADRLVVFGDSVNDLPMFAAADEAYAVSNAIDEVKAAATGIIGSNDEDSVAHFIARAERIGD